MQKLFLLDLIINQVPQGPWVHILKNLVDTGVFIEAAIEFDDKIILALVIDAGLQFLQELLSTFFVMNLNLLDCDQFAILTFFIRSYIDDSCWSGANFLLFIKLDWEGNYVDAVAIKLQAVNMVFGVVDRMGAVFVDKNIFFIELDKGIFSTYKRKNI